MRPALPALAVLAACNPVGIEVARPASDALATAPEFALPSQRGDTVALADVLSRGPALLVFYRGFW